jgi:diketogulonate reductase-like aldo/keto reductase
MLVRAIPASGEEIPVVGLGTWQTFDVGPRAPERRELAEVLSTFVELGGRLVDSSPMYGNADESVDLGAGRGHPPDGILAAQARGDRARPDAGA